MEIFYIDINKYMPKKEDLNKYMDDRRFASEEKEKQHLCGRLLIEKAAQEFYMVEDTELKIINKKPRFKTSKIHFNVSHSENLVVAAFDINAVGVDIEIMKERNFKELFARYNFKGEHLTKELFYKFWTEYEAGIKLQGTPKSKYTKIFLDKFMLSVSGNFSDDIKFYELTDSGFNCI